MTLFCWLFPGGMEYSEWFYPGGMEVNWVIHPGIIEQEWPNIPSTNGQKTLDNPTIRVTDIPGISQTKDVFRLNTTVKRFLMKFSHETYFCHKK